MSIDAAWIAVAFSGAAALLAFLAAFRSRPPEPALALLNDALHDLRGDLERLRTALADDLRRSRDEADARGRSQREEAGAILREGFARLNEGSRALREEVTRRLSETRKDGDENGKALRSEVTRQFQVFSDVLARHLGQSAATQKERLDGVAGEIHRLTQRSAEAQESLRKTVEGRLDALRQDNAAKLEDMRRTVDEKLQGALEQRLGESFRLVSDQLKQVYESVGEMQQLATGVGDLKRVLTNVKTRGTWGEVSLGAVLDQVLTSDQYGRSVRVRPGSGECVDFAIRLPGQAEGDEPLWLPIDAKFPSEAYERLLDASERSDGDGVERALKELEASIRKEGASICEKYVCPPHTTDFAILYLPTEGLYAEVIRRPGLMDDLQRRCRIVVAGPTVLLEILNSLQMGFRTLAIQKRSSEVWRLLGAVKTEFGKYGEVLDKVKKKLAEATETIDTVAVRRKQIDRKLAEVETLPDFEASRLLSFDGPPAPPAFVEAAA
jgi:DNA recombination protein RmuC